MTELHSFAWNAYDRGSEVHAVANPSQAELMFKEYKDKREEKITQLNSSLLERYGEQPLVLDRERALSELPSQTEVYVEYKPDGTVKKPEFDPILGHKVYINNHKADWASWTSEDGKPGYSCCHSIVKNSYCTGEEGIAADLEHRKILLTNGEEENGEGNGEGNADKDGADDKNDHDKNDANEKEEEDSEMHKRYLKMGVSRQEMESYRQKRLLSNDPMAQFMEGPATEVDASRDPRGQYDDSEHDKDDSDDKKKRIKRC